MTYQGNSAERARKHTQEVEKIRSPHHPEVELGRYVGKILDLQDEWHFFDNEGPIFPHQHEGELDESQLQFAYNELTSLCNPEVTFNVEASALHDILELSNKEQSMQDCLRTVLLAAVFRKKTCSNTCY